MVYELEWNMIGWISALWVPRCCSFQDFVFVKEVFENFFFEIRFRDLKQCIAQHMGLSFAEKLRNFKHWIPRCCSFRDLGLSKKFS